MSDAHYAAPKPFAGFGAFHSVSSSADMQPWNNDNDATARDRLFEMVHVDGTIVFVPRRRTSPAVLALAGLVIFVAIVVAMIASVLHFFVTGSWTMFVGGFSALVALGAVTWAQRILKRAQNAGADVP